MRKNIILFVQLASLLFLLSTIDFFANDTSAQIVPNDDKESLFPQTEIAPLQETMDGVVTHVINPYTIQLDNGKVIRLAGIIYPDYMFAEEKDEEGLYALLAIKIMRDMLIGQDVILYQTPEKKEGRTNRMGHLVGHIVRKKDLAWVQGMLLSLGLAQVYTQKTMPYLTESLLAYEAKAREASRGLWSEDTYHIKSIVELDELSDGFNIIEGKVISTALNRNRVYLNFGQDWRTDFTVSIAPSDKRAFVKDGIDPLTLDGKTLRVRGWLRRYNGPYIEINHPQAMEILSTN